jgi:hypothetical protein
MENQAPKKLSRQAARLQVNKALSSLTELQNSLGKKKFKRRMEKVEKLLSGGLPKEKKVKKLKPQEAA